MVLAEPNTLKTYIMNVITDLGYPLRLIEREYMSESSCLPIGLGLSTMLCYNFSVAPSHTLLVFFLPSILSTDLHVFGIISEVFQITSPKADRLNTLRNLTHNPGMIKSKADFLPSG
jgi:hypothetical protein